MGDQRVGRKGDISIVVLAAPPSGAAHVGGASQLQPLPGAGGWVRIPSVPHTPL